MTESSKHTGAPIPGEEARHSPRLKLPAMYTLVRVRPKDSERYCWTGYIYDISETGMRMELDQSLAPGTEVEVRAMLPGQHQTTFNASGRVVRLHDDDDLPGPTRMGLIFDKFTHLGDHRRLVGYLQNSGLAAAA